MITHENASRIRSRILTEFANGPTKREADAVMHERRMQLILDFLCNAGGVIVSYVEKVQNYNLDHWEESEVKSRLKKRISDTYRKVFNPAQRNNVEMLQAAYTIAVIRVVAAM